jgi:hypothetical protein
MVKENGMSSLAQKGSSAGVPVILAKRGKSIQEHQGRRTETYGTTMSPP